MPVKEAGVALVTGAGAGIGRAIARRLGEAGHRVVVSDIDIEGGRLTAEEIQAQGGRALFLAADMGRSRDVHDLIAETGRRFGGLNVLVNNAGIASNPPYPESDEDVWRRVIDVNLVGPMLATQLVLEQMRRNGGVVVNVASMAGWGLGVHENPEYAATKAALIRLTATLAPLAAEGIRVNAVCPGWVGTEKVLAYLNTLSLGEREREAPTRLIAPEEVAELVWMFVRDASLFGRVFVWPDDKPLFMPDPGA